MWTVYGIITAIAEIFTTNIHNVAMNGQYVYRAIHSAKAIARINYVEWTVITVTRFS